MICNSIFSFSTSLLFLSQEDVLKFPTAPVVLISSGILRIFKKVVFDKELIPLAVTVPIGTFIFPVVDGVKINPLTGIVYNEKLPILLTFTCPRLFTASKKPLSGEATVTSLKSITSSRSLTSKTIGIA